MLEDSSEYTSDLPDHISPHCRQSALDHHHFAHQTSPEDIFSEIDLLPNTTLERKEFHNITSKCLK